MINEQRLSKALTYLAETDEPCAELKTDVERYEFMAKASKDVIFLRIEGTIAERTAKAGTSDEYAHAMSAYFDALKKYEAMRNKRQTETIVVEVWRSLNSSRNKGNL